MVTYTEHLSCYMVLEFITAKSDVLNSLRKYVDRAENHHKPLRISYIRSDNGGQYTSVVLHSYFEEKGVICQRTAPRTPQQNTVVEHVNQTIFQIARSLLKHAGLAERYWPEAALYAAYIKNHLPKSNNGITPFEWWTGSAAIYDHIHTFGCLTYTVMPSKLRKQLDDIMYQSILLGYSEETMSQYRVLYLITKRIITTMDAHFDESMLYKDTVGIGKGMALLARVI